MVENISERLADGGGGSGKGVWLSALKLDASMVPVGNWGGTEDEDGKSHGVDMNGGLGPEPGADPDDAADDSASNDVTVRTEVLLELLKALIADTLPTHRGGTDDPLW